MKRLIVAAILFASTCVLAQVQPAQTPSPTDPAVHAKLNLPVPANPKLPTLLARRGLHRTQRPGRRCPGPVGLGRAAGHIL